ncbi:MAG: class I SAM-dependent methyltransferase, partial [Candidatus Aureabacteria bacterium]|nr:class I SAM-dependent methyltransferase [Candidatus Auribacterota bacterium]
MTYELLDSGNGKRLEKIGGGLFIRPAFYAVWPARLSSSFWKRAGFEFQGQSDGGKGRWVRHSPPSRSIFFIEYSGFHFECRLTDYGHVGVFFEQKDQWAWLEKNTYSGAQYLNLFAYTGGSTFAAAKKAAVTHVDSSGSVLSWAKKNADLS